MPLSSGFYLWRSLVSLIFLLERYQFKVHVPDFCQQLVQGSLVDDLVKQQRFAVLSDCDFHIIQPLRPLGGARRYFLIKNYIG